MFALINPKSISADQALCRYPDARAHHGETTDGFVWVLAIVGNNGDFFCNGYRAEFIPREIAEELLEVASILTTHEVVYWVETRI